MLLTKIRLVTYSFNKTYYLQIYFSEYIPCSRILIFTFAHIFLICKATVKHKKKIVFNFKGVTNAEREAFELLPDDERQCEVCKTTCFMSAMTCACTPDVLVCLRHYTSLCKCPPQKRTLRYRYTLDELLPLLRNLKSKAESFDKWVDQVKDALDPNTPKTLSLLELKALLSEAQGKNFPKSDLIQTLANAIEDAEKCASVIKQLDLNKIRTRNSGENKSKLTYEELTLFCEEIDSLACILEEEAVVKELLERTLYFEKESARLLELPLEEILIPEIEACLEDSMGLVMDLPTLAPLNDRMNQLKWLREVRETRSSPNVPDVAALRNLLNSGLHLPSDVVIVRTLHELQKLINAAEEWEEQAQALLNKKDGQNILIEAEQLLKEGRMIDVYLPTEGPLQESVQSATEWFDILNLMNAMEFYPYLNSVEDLVKKSRNFLFHFEEVDRLKAFITAATTWKEKTSRTFLKRNSVYNLMDALSPRVQIPYVKVKRKNQEEDTFIKICDNMDPAAVVAAFKDAEDQEMKNIKNIRSINSHKNLDAPENETFCICKKGVFGVMMQCDLCKEWYHSACVTLPKVATMKIRTNLMSTLLHLGYKDCKFLCPNCNRTRRPRLESILSLLMSLQKLHTRLPEGEALQCLTERAMNWQDRARQLMKMPELEKARKKVQCVMKKFQDILNNRTDGNKSDSGVFSEHNFYEDDEHAYSLHISKLEDMEQQLVISSCTYQMLEELVMEGDLLEVSLDESIHLWQIMQVVRDPEREFVVDFDVSTFALLYLLVFLRAVQRPTKTSGR